MATGNGEWTTVTQRRRASPIRPPSSPGATSSFKPFHTLPSYAEVLRRATPEPQTAARKVPSPKPINPRPRSPPSPSSPTSAAFYISPHSPSGLRFPPSPHFPEWRGRCFQCCRQGHTASSCRNHKRCGRCWGMGHIGSACTNNKIQLAKVVPPSAASNGEKKTSKGEPSFEALLKEPSKPLPDGRPRKLLCFVNRDAEYHEEVEKLKGVVVMHGPHLEVDLSIENVAGYAEKTGLVTAKEVSVGIMPKSRYAILLPHGLAVDTFIRAMPREVWDEGFSFSQWSHMDGAAIENPQYQVLIDFIGIPMDLYREKEVIRATSTFGTYLGTIEQSTPGDIASWTVAVATTDLALIPHSIGYKVGGLELEAELLARTWIRRPLYSSDEIPRPVQKYHPPLPKSEEVVPLPRRVIQDLCRGRDPTTLPEEVRMLLADGTVPETQSP